MNTENKDIEENILVAPPNYKLYDDRAVFVGTFIGGPLAAGYLIAENYKNLEERGKVLKTWLFAILATIVIIGVAFLIPTSSGSPSYILPLLYSWFASYLAKWLQGDRIKLHRRDMGELYTRWRAALVGLIGLVITFVIIFIVLYIDVSRKVGD
jgi:hypothetical protein